MVLKHNKRPFGGDEFDELPQKYSRQLECGDELASFAGFSSLYGFSQDQLTSDGEAKAICGQRDQCHEAPPVGHTGEGSSSSGAVDDKLEGSRDTALTTSPPEAAILGTNEDDTWSEPPDRISCFPTYFDYDRRTTTYDYSEEYYSSVFDFPPRKHVAIGQDHQADIPAWESRSLGNPSRASADGNLDEEDCSDRWIGTCVLPMLESGSSRSEVRVEHCEADCDCFDQGSISCVRQHVMEAREQLKEKLGQDTFIQLGFDDMGEVVAQKWSQEEQQVFQEVVLSNPASLGKNFWDYLPRVFPSKSRKELVSYYFNVFMLRKRAEQNRLDPLNVDSDNDEWQGSDDGEYEDDEEDSMVESPGEDVTFDHDGRAVEIHEEADGDNYDDCIVAGDDDERLAYFTERCISDRPKFNPDVQGMDPNLHDGMDDHDVQDDSCTSFEGQHNGVDFCGGQADAVETQDSLLEDNRDVHIEDRNNGLSCLTDHIMGRCDPKPWDMSFYNSTQKEIDFLPTCNMIEEVFGKGAWENDAMKGKGFC